MRKKINNYYKFSTTIEEAEKQILKYKIKELQRLESKFKKVKINQIQLCHFIEGKQPHLSKMINHSRNDISKFSFSNVLRYKISVCHYKSMTLTDSQNAIDMYKIILGNRIVEKIRSLNVSQQYVANHFNTTQSRIGCLCTSKTFDSFSLAMLMKYAIVLNVKHKDYPTK
ncbi:helix-turn-helix domain-containing protein [Vibrio harveyi]|uniref:hypothetical protein n=1 Tax=Vibrio harveyi TaxID=669 RepID=UPI00237EFC59|nr:hypothetical protein [Vibrio harveyi]HDM8069019.1 hypothetical protein [Vibrio harveyi]